MKKSPLLPLLFFIVVLVNILILSFFVTIAVGAIKTAYTKFSIK